MALKDITDQLSQQFIELGQKIQDSAAYQNLKEKYDDLPSQQQKLVVLLIGFFLIFFIFSIPYDNYKTSDASVIVFEEQRQMVKNLTDVAKETSGGLQFFPSPPVGQVKTDMEMRLQQFQLLPEQMAPLQVDMGSSAGLIPAPRQEGSIKITLKKLNLRQLIDITAELQKVNSNARLASFKVDSHLADPRYLDALLDFIIIKVPQVEVEQEASSPAPTKRRNRQ